MSNKVSDEWSVPLCFAHHRALHTVGNEETWWAEKGIDAKAEALRLWRQSHEIPEPTEVATTDVDPFAPLPRSPQTHSVVVPDNGDAGEIASENSAAAE
jgi:hypothetical protein